MPINTLATFTALSPAYASLVSSIPWGLQAPSVWTAVIAAFLALSAFVAAAALISQMSIAPEEA